MVVWIEIITKSTDFRPKSVTTCVVVWIEMLGCSTILSHMAVTTCVVVWIEIWIFKPFGHITVSPPAWWCGLKFTER